MITSYFYKFYINFEMNNIFSSSILWVSSCDGDPSVFNVEEQITLVLAIFDPDTITYSKFYKKYAKI